MFVCYIKHPFLGVILLVIVASNHAKPMVKIAKIISMYEHTHTNACEERKKNIMNF